MLVNGGGVKPQNLTLSHFSMVFIFGEFPNVYSAQKGSYAIF